MTADATGLAKGVQRCTVPGCTGTIEDGYCNVCGTPAGARCPARPSRAVPFPAQGGAGTGGGQGLPDDPSATGAVAGTDGAVSTRSSVTSSSNRLASTPLGSVRAGGSRTTRKLGTSSTRLRRRPARRRPHHDPVGAGRSTREGA